jgi:uncharacterized protein (TIGR02421 family)
VCVAVPQDTTDREKERIRRVAQILHTGAQSMRILQSVAWPPEVKDAFLAQAGRELPVVSYEPFDPRPVIEAVREARRSIVPVTPVDSWLERQADALELGARMLAAIGTGTFFEHARRLYGEPTAPLRYLPQTPLDLAQSIRETIEQLAHIDIGIGPPAHFSAEEVARELEAAVRQHFGADAPAVEVVDRLSANALATSRALRIRRGARFTDRDMIQLLNHEAFIHVATSLNGRAQTDLPILGVGHPGTTRTQEGLAVFAEVITGAMELDRLLRLADRVFAIQMAIDGADFRDVYRYFLERIDNPDQAFENARRVFRGGVITGGAPFTKDVVYLLGLLQVSNFVRASFAAGRADCLSLLFCGKLDLFDIPALCELSVMGLCRAPKYLPPWVSDPRHLLALLTYSVFTNRMDLEPVVQAVRRLLDSAPVVRPQELRLPDVGAMPGPQHEVPTS